MAKIDSTTASQKLLSANSNRKGVTIENSDANRLHVLMDSGTASTTNYSFSLAQNDSAVLQFYTGELNGIWAADGSGSAFVTEW
jgi:hypothetical protein